MSEHDAPPVHTAEEHKKVAELLKGNVHNLSMERLAVSHTVAPPPVVAAPAPAPVPTPEEGSDATDAEAAVPAPPVALEPAAPTASEAAVVQEMVGDKVERKLK